MCNKYTSIYTYNINLLTIYPHHRTPSTSWQPNQRIEISVCVPYTRKLCVFHTPAKTEQLRVIWRIISMPNPKHRRSRSDRHGGRRQRERESSFMDATLCIRKTNGLLIYLFGNHLNIIQEPIHTSHFKQAQQNYYKREISGISQVAAVGGRARLCYTPYVHQREWKTFGSSCSMG